MSEFDLKVKSNLSVDTLILYHPTKPDNSRDEEIEDCFGIMEDLKDEYVYDKGIQFYNMDCYLNEMGDLLPNCFNTPHFIYYNAKKKVHFTIIYAEFQIIKDWVKEKRGNFASFQEIDL